MAQPFYCSWSGFDHVTYASTDLITVKVVTFRLSLIVHTHPTMSTAERKRRGEHQQRAVSYLTPT